MHRSDVIGGVIACNRPARIDPIAGGPDRALPILSKHPGIVISAEESVQEVVFEFRHESLQGDIAKTLCAQEHEQTSFVGGSPDGKSIIF